MTDRAAKGHRLSPRAAIEALPLFWKLLLPFLTLIAVLGASGGFLIVRDLSGRAQAALDRELAARALDARSTLRDRELYLLESANFASNIQDMARAIQSGERVSVARLLQSVLALKTDLDLLAGTSADGVGLVEFLRPTQEAEPELRSGTQWSGEGFVAEALRSETGSKSSGLLSVEGRRMLAIAAPVCSGVQTCAPVGVAIVGMGWDRLSAAALGKEAEAASAGRTGVTIYDSSGHLLANSGLAASGTAPRFGAGAPAQRTEMAGRMRVVTVYELLEVQGRGIGTLAVSVPRDPAFASVRQAGIRLALVLLTVMGGVVLIGVGLNRFILARLRSLVATNRALGRGELSARAPALGGDELGELAAGVNQMAEQLQAIYETLELRVVQRTEEVERLLSERTEFFASISHEFRTPLAVILQHAQMLFDPTYPRNGRFGAKTGRSIKAAGDQLQLLIDDILDLAKAERGTLEVHIENVRVQDVIREMRGTIEALARGSELRTDILVPRDLPEVRADPRRLREVIQNLVDNAIKYTPNGGRVTLEAVTGPNKTVSVSVSDTGVGIPDGAGEQIFEPFARVHETIPLRGQASSGLGLALSKRLVEAQGGTIAYVSREGAGTTFTFTLSAARQAPRRIRRVS